MALLCSPRVDPRPLTNELEQVFADGILVDAMNAGAGGIHFLSVPMMSGRTPASSRLADTLAGTRRASSRPTSAAGTGEGYEVHGGERLARGQRARHPERWFRRLSRSLASGVGCARSATRITSWKRRRRGRGPVALETQPGDIVAFDEHLTHGSVGGGDRRQWRVDFIADPCNDREEELVRRSFAQVFDIGWDGGYDALRYPSYGEFWQQAHPEWARRLDRLGVIELARAQEAVMLHRREASGS